MKKKTQPEVIFADIKDENEPIIVESLCMNCEQNGKTIMLLTKIPFFRQLIISSFFCEECGFKNNEVQFGGKLPDYGVDILFRVLDKKDLNRELIKSEFSVIHFDQIDLEVPPNGKAEINTIEGYLRRTYDELHFHQALRKIHQPQNYQKLEIWLEKMRTYMDGEKFPLTIRIKDPSGNSTIKNPYAPKQDKNLEIRNYQRQMSELIMMGYSEENAKQEISQIETQRLCTKINFTKPFEQNNFMNQEPVIFEVACHACQMMGEMRMCQTNVPYFTDLIIMSFRCDYCGAHSTQTKNSGVVNENASILTLDVEGDDDLKRDLFKSETCGVNLPEIELELGYGTLGGVFTTVQGLLEKIVDHFSESNPFVDSDKEFTHKIQSIVDDLTIMREGKRKFRIIFTDPLSHSFLSNPKHPDADPRLKIEFRKRTFEQNEELGLNDIKVQGYGESKETVQSNSQQGEQQK